MSEEALWFRGVKYRVLEGKEGVREAYDGMANSYDYSEYLYWTRRMEDGEERVIGKWIRNFSSPVLDVGCGTGRYAIKIAEAGFEVIALDMSLRMLKKTMEKARKNNVSRNVDLVLADGESLPFRRNSFKGLICTLAFGHLENNELAAQEFLRVLEDEGLCIITSLNSYTFNDFRRRYNIPLDKTPFRTEDLQPSLIYEVGYSADELKGLFSKYKFDTIDVKGCCYWHLLPANLIKHYKTKLDPLFNIFKPLLKYAEIHAVLLQKR